MGRIGEGFSMGHLQALRRFKVVRTETMDRGARPAGRADAEVPTMRRVVSVLGGSIATKAPLRDSLIGGIRRQL